VCHWPTAKWCAYETNELLIQIRLHVTYYEKVTVNRNLHSATESMLDSLHLKASNSKYDIVNGLLVINELTYFLVNGAFDNRKENQQQFITSRLVR